MAACKKGHDPSELRARPRDGSVYCNACARERYRANKGTLRRKEHRVPEQIAYLQAAEQAGTLDALLMARLFGKAVDSGDGSLADSVL